MCWAFGKALITAQADFQLKDSRGRVCIIINCLYYLFVQSYYFRFDRAKLSFADVTFLRDRYLSLYARVPIDTTL